MKITMDYQKLLAASKFASKEKEEPFTACVSLNFKAKTLDATNRHILVRVDLEKELQDVTEELDSYIFKVPEDLKGSTKNTTVTIDTVENTLVTTTPKRDGTESVITYQLKVIDFRYVNIDSAAPMDTPFSKDTVFTGERICINSVYIGLIGTAFGKDYYILFCGGGETKCPLIFKVLGVDEKDGYWGKTFGLVMPVRVPKSVSEGESKDGESKDGESKDGESKDGESKDGESKDGE